VPEALEIDYVARRQVPSLVGLSVFLLLCIAAWVTDVLPGWLAAALTVVLGVVVLYGLLLVRCLASGVRVARLDGAGISVVGAEPVPWSDVREVVLGPVRPAWLLGGSLRTAAFLPQPGVALPGPPGIDGRQSERGRAARQRLYGTNLMLQTSLMSVDAEQLAVAAQELGGVPVRRVRVRTARLWLLLVGGAVVVGAVAGVVSGLVG
jgi:hypothetical protein